MIKSQKGSNQGTTSGDAFVKPDTPIKDIPEFLLCRITDDLMEEPVILSSGFTYEKSAILKHFTKNGHYDPVTR